MNIDSIPSEYLPVAFTPTVCFKDESVLNAKAGYNQVTDEIWIYPDDSMTFIEAAILFSDVEKTDYIRIDYSSIDYDEFVHYTHLKTIQENAVGKMAIRLQRN